MTYSISIVGHKRIISNDFKCFRNQNAQNQIKETVVVVRYIKELYLMIS